MANIRLGSHASHEYQVAETIAEAKQLTWNDSGKLFFVEQGTGTYVINLPKLSEEICGWQTKFLVSKLGDAVEINVYGSPAGGNSGVEDEEKVNYIEVTINGPVLDTTTDGMQLTTSLNALGTYVEVVTDGTKWYIAGIAHNAGSIAKVGA